MAQARMESLKRKSFLDVSSLWISQMGAVLLAFLTQLMLARILNIEEYGAFSAALNIATILGGIASFGSGSNLLRAFGVEGWKGTRWVKPTLVINVFVIIALISVLVITLDYFNFSTLTNQLIYCFCFIIVTLGLTNIAESVYQLEENFRGLALLKFLLHGLRFIVVLLALFLSFNVVEIGIGYALCSVILLFIYLSMIGRMLHARLHLKGHGPKPALKETRKPTSIFTTLKFLSPYGLTIIFYNIYFQGNIFILNIIQGEESVAIYNVAFTILNVVFLFPTTFYQSYLVPKIHRWSNDNQKKILVLFMVGNKGVISIGVILMILITTFATIVVPLLFGQKYYQSGLILILLSIAIPLRLIANNIGSILVTEKHVSKKALYQFIGAVVGIGSNIFFIQLYGVFGAALAVVFTELVVTVLFVYGALRYMPDIKVKELTQLKKFILILFCSVITVLIYFYIMYVNAPFLYILMAIVLFMAIFGYIAKIIVKDKAIKFR